MNLTIPTVGISISEPDIAEMAALGIGLVHVQDAMVETARFLLNKGYKLAYGGDLNYDGTFNFTELLCQLARTYGGIEGRIVNYSAFPYYTKIAEKRKAELVNIATVVKVNCSGEHDHLINVQYDHTTPEVRHYLDQLFAADGEAALKVIADNLTAMRKKMTEEIQCRIVIGGRSEGYKGRMSGIWEETLFCIENHVSIYIDGRFGGAAREIVNSITQQGSPTQHYHLGEKTKVVYEAPWQIVSLGVMYLKGAKEYHDIHNLFRLL